MFKFLALFPLTISSMKIFKSCLNNSFISDIDDSDEKNIRKGMDERFKSPELTELYDEMNTIEINYYRKHMLDTLEHEYISDEKPYFKSSNQFDDERLDRMLRPSDEDSTELGDVPQDDRKGSMTKQIGPYGFQYNYSLIREDESED